MEIFSDYGEPGTAGDSIIPQVTDRVVTRLMEESGTGGLWRAYGSAALGCLESAQRVEYLAETSLWLG